MPLLLFLGHHFGTDVDIASSKRLATYIYFDVHLYEAIARSDEYKGEGVRHGRSYL